MLRTPSYVPLVLAALLAMAGVAHAEADACTAATSSLYVGDSSQTSFPAGYLSCAAADGSTIAQCVDCTCRDRASGTNGTITVEYFLCVQGVASCVSSTDGLRTSCPTSTAASVTTSAPSSAAGNSTGTTTSTAGSTTGASVNTTATASPTPTTATPVTASSSSGTTEAAVGDSSASGSTGNSTSSSTKKNTDSSTKDISTSSATSSSDSTMPSGTVAAASNGVSGTGSSTTTNTETAAATDSAVSDAPTSSTSSNSADSASALGTSNGNSSSSSKSSSTVLAAGCAVAGIAAVALFAVSKKRKTNDDVLGTPKLNGRRKKSHGDTYQDSDTSKAAAMVPKISQNYGNSSARMTGMSALDELDNFQLDIQAHPPPPMPESVPMQAPMTVLDLCKTATPEQTIVIPRESSNVANSPPDFRFSSFSVNESEMQRPGGFASMARMDEEDDEASSRQGPALTMDSLGDSGFSNFRDSRLTLQSARDTSSSVNSTMSSVYDTRDTDASDFLRDSDENGFHDSSSSVQFERSPSKKRPSIEF